MQDSLFIVFFFLKETTQVHIKNKLNESYVTLPHSVV